MEKSGLKRVEVFGHASNTSENSVICAAVSCLSRTVGEIASRLNGVSSCFEAPKHGELLLTVNSIDESVHERFCGITDFFIIGIIGVVRDYPESIKLKINNKEWYNGSQERWW